MTMVAAMGCSRNDHAYSDQAEIIAIGEYRVGTMPMATMGLGSCIALIIHDRREQQGGMAHAMLPESRPPADRPGKFVDTALTVLVGDLEAMGSSKRRMEARVVGGARMFESSTMLNIGERNVQAVRALLKEEGIPLTVCEVGGRKGRSVIYNPENGGTIRIRTADGPWQDF